ncbi:MAG: ExbD/TolR family protein [Candidatus Methylacidiphilales bacterium]
MQFYSRPKRPLTINIVSMIDILSILLIFFIVTTTFKKATPKVEIKLPESARAQEAENPNEPVMIYLTKEQQIFLGERPVVLDQLAGDLRAEVARQPNKVFVLEADEGIPLGFFVKVMDAAKEAGLADLSLNTRKPEKP